MRTQGIGDRFAVDVAGHQMIVLHEDGIYRHLRFRHPDRGAYWFDLVTWPGCLSITGDMDAWTFSRTEDMFEFFRGDRINPQYWAEKVRAGRGDVLRYDEEHFRRIVADRVAEDEDDWPGLGEAVAAQIFASGDIGHEEGARDALDAFKFGDYRFRDTWEWELRDWSYQFLWCCHAIQWGIGVHDRKAVPVTAAVTP